MWLNEFFGEVREGSRPFEHFKLAQDLAPKLVGSVLIRKRNPDTFEDDVQQMLRARLTFDEAIAAEGFLAGEQAAAADRPARAVRAIGRIGVVSLAQPELPLKVVPGKRTDVRAFAAKVFERHGIALKEDDPAFALVTLNELILRKLMGELLKDVDGHMTARLAEFEQTMQRVEARASKVLAQQVRESAGGLSATLQAEISGARLDVQRMIGEIRIDTGSVLWRAGRW